MEKPFRSRSLSVEELAAIVRPLPVEKGLIERLVTPDRLRALKAAGRFTLILLALGAIFYFLAGFSIRQSIALALLATYAVYGFRGTERTPHLRFVPHYVHVLPRWYEILTDTGVISNSEEYDRLYEMVQALPPEQYNIFRSGIRFTVLDDFPTPDRRLVYSEDARGFQSRVGFVRPLKPLPRIVEEWERNHPEVSEELLYLPEFCLQRGLDGYNMGIVVPTSWWEERKTALGESRFEALRDPMGVESGTVLLTLATIPGSEFTLYWKRRLEPYDKGAEIWRTERNENRTRFGWVAEEKPFVDGPENLRHKYFHVEHGPI